MGAILHNLAKDRERRRDQQGRGMNPHPGIDELLADYEARWDEGDVSAVAEAVAFCGYNSYPLPSWCVDPCMEALSLYNAEGGRGRVNTRAAKFAELQKKQRRHALVKLELEFSRDAGKPVTIDKACEIVAQKLPSENVSARAVLKSYREIAATLKAAI
ncbi:MAG: hypothetical protein QM698_14225 [Micropepsaceae bacterium]